MLKKKENQAGKYKCLRWKSITARLENRQEVLTLGTRDTDATSQLLSVLTDRIS